MEMSQPPSFAQLLKRFRAAAGLSQEALAERAGLATRGISDLERGINRAPRLDTLEQIAAALGLAPDERAAFEESVRRVRQPRGGAAVALPTPVPADWGGGGHASTPDIPDRDGAAPPLPVQPTGLVGRDRDVAAVTGLLRAGARLLTLSGPGGVGKTRLALQVAAGLGDLFPDGAIFVPLAPVAGPDLVATTLAQALGLHGRDDRPPRDILAAHLAGKRALLLLDNFEHLIEASSLVADLAASCPALHILVTSRALLRVRGERAYVVPPLVLPDRATAPDAAAIAGSPAIQLFLARAREVSPDFALTDANAPLVARICARLDGLPLAIELAAARLKVLAPSALLSRLEAGLGVLAGGPRDLPPHQRTLRDTIAWSYNLLDAPTQALFLRLAVFAGGCTPEAADAFCAGPDIAGDAADGMADAAGVAGVAEPDDVLEALTTLVDSSLLQREGRADDVRFAMLETVREYAFERLLGHALEALRGRHAAYMLGLVETAASARTGAGHAPWLARLEQERDNLRAALQWALERGHAETALRLAGLSRWFWLERGHVGEGRYWLGRALAAADAAGLGGDTLATGLNAAAVLAANADAYDEAAALLERCLAVRRDMGDERGRAAALANLGGVAMHQHDYERAAALFADALAFFRALGDARSSAGVLGNLGESARLQGDGARAAAWAAESLALYEGLGDAAGAERALHTMGGAALLRDDVAGAAAAYGDALARAWGLRDIIATAHDLEGLAVVAARRGQYEHATFLFGAAAVVREQSEVPIPPVDRAVDEQALAAARAGLSAEAFAAARTAGREAPLAQAVSAALDMVSVSSANVAEREHEHDTGTHGSSGSHNRKMG